MKLNKFLSLLVSFPLRLWRYLLFSTVSASIHFYAAAQGPHFRLCYCSSISEILSINNLLYSVCILDGLDYRLDRSCQQVFIWFFILHVLVDTLFSLFYFPLSPYYLGFTAVSLFSSGHSPHRASLIFLTFAAPSTLQPLSLTLMTDLTA